MKDLHENVLTLASLCMQLILSVLRLGTLL
jgi:hypothetical protein